MAVIVVENFLKTIKFLYFHTATRWSAAVLYQSQWAKLDHVCHEMQGVQCLTVHHRFFGRLFIVCTVSWKRSRDRGEFNQPCSVFLAGYLQMRIHIIPGFLQPFDRALDCPFQADPDLLVHLRVRPASMLAGPPGTSI